MVMITISTLSEEHTKFMHTLTNRKNFGIQENVDKFKTEVVRFNELSASLVHCTYDHCAFRAIQGQRGI